jgi:hypothetical protein
MVRPLISLGLVLSLLAGCASPGTSIALKPEFTREPKPVRVQLALTERQYTATAMSKDTSAAHAAAAGTGQVGGIGAVVVGHLLAEAIIRGAEQGNVSRHPDPLLDFTRSTSIGEQYGRQFRASLEGSRWIRLTGMDVVKDGTDVPTPDSLSRRFPDEAVMSVRTQYYFSTTYQQMYVETAVELWPAGGGGEPVYRAAYRFCSPAIGASDLEETLLLWSASDAARFRATLAWGLQENLRMLRAAIAETNRGAAAETGPTERFAYTDRVGNTVEFDAQLLEQTPQARMLRADGDYYVLARRDMPLAELDRYITMIDRSAVVAVRPGS